MTGPLLLPEFVFGQFRKVERGMKRLARGYAKAMLAGEALVDPPLRAVPPGAVMLTGTYTGERSEYWYLVEIASLIGFTGSEYYELTGTTLGHDAMLSFLWARPWGALGLTITLPTGCHDAERFAQRVDRALELVELARGYRFRCSPDGFGSTFPELDYEGVLKAHLLDDLAAWDPGQPGASVETRLRAAVERLRSSSDAETRARLVERVVALRAAQPVMFGSCIPEAAARVDIAARLCALPAATIAQTRAGTVGDCVTLAGAMWPESDAGSS
jgi:hypothetical protein